jgi:hypothetical protein
MTEDSDDIRGSRDLSADPLNAETNNENDIDYLHPEGKPVTGSKPPATEDARPSLHDMRQAIDEADGHYMPRRDPYLHGS